jgi:hypothetical protein
MAGAMEHQAALLLRRLGRDEPHVCPSDRLADGLSIGSIILLPSLPCFCRSSFCAGETIATSTASPSTRRLVMAPSVSYPINVPRRLFELRQQRGEQDPKRYGVMSYGTRVCARVRARYNRWTTDNPAPPCCGNPADLSTPGPTAPSSVRHLPRAPSTPRCPSEFFPCARRVRMALLTPHTTFTFPAAADRVPPWGGRSRTDAVATTTRCPSAG